MVKIKFRSLKCRVQGVHKKPLKEPRMNFPRATTDFYVQEYWYISLNTKLGQIMAYLGVKSLLNPYFKPKCK